MMTLFFALLVLGILLAFTNWRWGLFAAVLIGLVQDPMRKMSPDASSLFTLGSAPVWITCFLRSWYSGEVSRAGFLQRFPRLGQATRLFAAYLLIPAVLSATYSPGSWKITLLGAFMISLVGLAVATGHLLALRKTSPLRLISAYTLAASVALLGGLLEMSLGSGAHPVLGTDILGHEWVTYRTGEAVYMRAGFFRGPDIMGWHAALVFMLASILAIRSRGLLRLLWVGLTIWASVNVWICGRRKMLAMAVLFLLYLIGLYAIFRGSRRSLAAVGLLLFTAAAGYTAVTVLLQETNIRTFYLTTLVEADDQLRQHGVESVATTLRQAGVLGYGLGMGQQGVHHIAVEKPNTWQESGPTKLLAEFGLPGTLLYFWLCSIGLLTLIQLVRRFANHRDFPLAAGLIAILLANASAAFISAQIYGDPFIALFLALLTGMIFGICTDAPHPEASAPCA